MKISACQECVLFLVPSQKMIVVVCTAHIAWMLLYRPSHTYENVHMVQRCLLLVTAGLHNGFCDAMAGILCI